MWGTQTQLNDVILQTFRKYAFGGKDTPLKFN